MFTILKKVAHFIISKSGSYGHNHKRHAHIIISIMVRPYYKALCSRVHLVLCHLDDPMRWGYVGKCKSLFWFLFLREGKKILF